MALRVIMRGRANSVEEAKRFISNNHGPEPRYIYEDKEQNGKIWLSNQLGDPIGFYEPATKTVKMIDKKTVDADIKFVNKGQKFKNENGAIVEVISDVDKLGQVTFKMKAPTQTFPDSKTVKVDGLINMLNKNGYVPTKDAKMPVPGNHFVKGDKVQYGNRKGVVKNAYGDVVVVQLEGDPKGDYSHLSYYTVKYAKDAAYFDPMYKDTRRAVVREAEKYISSKGLNNSTGKYDKAIFGVRNLLEKTLLQPGTDKFNDAVHREVDRLLRKYNLTADSKYEISYGKGRPGGDKEIKEFSDYKEAQKYAANSAKGWGYEIKKVKDSVEVLQTKNGYTLGVNNGKLVLAFKGETLENPHMWLGDAKNAKNMKQAVNLFEEFANGKKVKDAANGSVDDYLKKMNNKTQAEVEKILRQAKGNPNADKAYRIWKSTVKDADMEKEYSYSIRIGGDLKKVRVKANNSDEALAKVKAEAIKFKADRVKTKWDNNKLSTRDLTKDSNYFDKNELNNFSLDELKKMENTFKLKLSDLSKKYSKALKSNSREASSLGVSLSGTEKALFEIQAEIKRRR